jgi:hypothetical protein
VTAPSSAIQVVASEAASLASIHPSSIWMAAGSTSLTDTSFNGFGREDVHRVQPTASGLAYLICVAAVMPAVEQVAEHRSCCRLRVGMGHETPFAKRRGRCSL